MWFTPSIFRTPIYIYVCLIPFTKYNGIPTLPWSMRIPMVTAENNPDSHSDVDYPSTISTGINIKYAAKCVVIKERGAQHLHALCVQGNRNPVADRIHDKYSKTRARWTANHCHTHIRSRICSTAYTIPIVKTKCIFFSTSRGGGSQRPPLQQDAQLSQRDRAAGYISFGRKWKTGTQRQYFADIVSLASTTVT